MTCIIGGIDGNGSAWIVGDRLIADFGLAFQGIKVWQLGEVLLGGSGDTGRIQIFQEKLSRAQAYGITAIVALVRDQLIADRAAHEDMWLLLAEPGRIVEIDPLGAVSECGTYHAIGSGREVAFGALDAMVDVHPTREQLGRALSIAG
jgi:ATP-dependent protease HslVU (ClpYQ) peptidase subunit